MSVSEALASAVLKSSRTAHSAQCALCTVSFPFDRASWDKYMFNGNISMKFYDMSHFARSNGKETVQRAHCALWHGQYWAADSLVSALIVIISLYHCIILSSYNHIIISLYLIIVSSCHCSYDQHHHHFRDQNDPQMAGSLPSSNSSSFSSSS